MITGFLLFPLWMFFSVELCLLTFYRNLSSDSDGVPNLCKVVTPNPAWNVAAEIVPVVDWLTNPNPVTSPHRIKGWISTVHFRACVLCCQLFHTDENPTVMRHKELTFPLWYVVWWCKVVVWHHANAMCCVFCIQCGLCLDIRYTRTLWASHFSFQLCGHWSERHSKYAIVLTGQNRVSFQLRYTVCCMR